MRPYPRNINLLVNAIFSAFSLICICLSISGCSDKGEWQSSHPRSANEQWVAHAGGHINGIHYTNSLEALDASKRSGMHLVELDFEWTQDGHLVLLHDWDEAVGNTFHQPAGQRTLAQFKSFKSSTGLTPMSAKDLFAWLDNNPDVVIVTDVKSHELKALKWIQANYPAYAERFIPQIYHFEEYEPVRRLGYYRVILTLYRIHKKADKEILAFCKTHPVWAVTMEEKRVWNRTLVKDINLLHIPVYAHTINDPEKAKMLFNAGVFGIYVDRTELKNELPAIHHL